MITLPNPGEDINHNGGGKNHKSKQKFSPEEDKQLSELVKQYGERGWKRIALSIPFRTARQCRERWINYLSPQVSLEPWSSEEDMKLHELTKILGQQWSKISNHFSNRTDVMIKNRWALLQRRMKKNTLSQSFRLFSVMNTEPQVKKEDVIEGNAVLNSTNQDQGWENEIADIDPYYYCFSFDE